MTESTADPRPKSAVRRRRRSRRPRNADPQADTRVDILKSAAKAFRKLGYHGATVEQIAAALHMKKGNLYYYFKNKEEILFACHQYSLDRLTRLLEDIEESDAEPDDKLRRLVSAFVHTILDELHGTALFLDLEALTPAHLRAVIVRRDRFDRGVRNIVQQGIATGLFAAPGSNDVKLITFAMMGAVNWIPRWFKPEGAASSQEIADRFAAFFVEGLRTR
ncbi:MAG TPA: TetR/AcrR family transcriptional regulator [Vicinamibacterales bacterium]|nr:TetR/AcrR family transcriptional regulator [Vicinamibacterales bacterium]